jgi:hypothetical protein
METEPLFVAAGDRLRRSQTECRLVFLVKKAGIKTNQTQSSVLGFNP